MNRVACLSILAVTFTLSAAAHTLSAQTKAFKDKNGTCQVLLPADWQLDDITGEMKDPKSLIRVSVFWERDAKVEPYSAMAMDMNNVEKMFENTAQRIFYQEKPIKFGPVPTYAYTVYTPAPQKGACHGAISMKPGADEPAAKQIALTLGPAK